MTNMTGEKLSVNQVIEAMARSGAALGVPIEHFKVEPDYDDSRYVFKVECSELRPDQRGELLRHIERSLGSLNIEYEARRASARLKDPLLLVMKDGWYERGKQALVAEGKRLFQAKTVLLDAKAGYTPEPEEVEEEVCLA